MNILFLCTGNTCRGPMAEKIFRHMAEDKQSPVFIKSAGISAISGQPISGHAASLLEEQGFSADHSSQPLSNALLEWADLVLTMTETHKQLATGLNNRAADKVFTLKEYTGARGSLDIQDPFGGSLDIYRECADELKKYLRVLSEKTARQ